MAEITEMLVKVFVGYVSLLVLTRLAGRKQVAQLTFFDYVTGITIGSITGGFILDDKLSVGFGVFIISIWFGLLVLTDVITLKMVPARKVFEAEPLLVIYNGQILEENLGKRFYNVNDLLMELRSNGVFNPAEVELGIIEETGKLSILKKAANQALTPATAMSPPPETPPAIDMVGKEIIIDGTLMGGNMKEANISEEWLAGELDKRGITDYGQVTLAMLSPDGNLYVDLKRDSVPEHQRSGYLE